MKNYIIIILLVCISLAIAKTDKQDKLKKESNKTIKVDDKYSFNIINAVSGTYGYDILSNNKVMIHQPNIPAVSGNVGFKDKKDAEKVAKFVIYKLNKNIMPPSVTPQEIDSLIAIK